MTSNRFALDPRLNLNKTPEQLEREALEAQKRSDETVAGKHLENIEAFKKFLKEKFDEQK